jgi:hypothetical protein
LLSYNNQFYFLLVVSIVESAVSNAKISFEIVSVRVLLVALEESKSGDEVSLLEVVGPVWQLEFFLERGSRGEWKWRSVPAFGLLGPRACFSA